jgi:hypothetical protein
MPVICDRAKIEQNRSFLANFDRKWPVFAPISLNLAIRFFYFCARFSFERQPLLTGPRRPRDSPGGQPPASVRVPGGPRGLPDLLHRRAGGASVAPRGAARTPLPSAAAIRYVLLFWIHRPVASLGPCTQAFWRRPGINFRVQKRQNKTIPHNGLRKFPICLKKSLEEPPLSIMFRLPSILGLPAKTGR